MGTTTNNNTGAWNTTDGELGIDLNNVVASVSLGSNPFPMDQSPQVMKLGQRLQGDNGSEWLFVQASTTVTQNNVVVIDVNFKANNITSALVTSGLYSYGVAAFVTTLANTNEFFWACLNARGGLLINVTDTAVRGALMYVSVGTPGSLTTTASANVIQGIRANTSMSSTTTTVDVVMTGYMWAYVSV